MSITKQQLKQYRHKKTEIELLDRQIISALPVECVSDVVKGSHMQPVSVTGYGSNSIPAKSNRQAVLIMECRQTEEFVNSIDDSFIRTILILKYIKGFEWNAVAFHIGGDNTADSVRKASERFLRNL